MVNPYKEFVKEDYAYYQEICQEIEYFKNRHKVRIMQYNQDELADLIASHIKELESLKDRIRVSYDTNQREFNQYQKLLSQKA